MQKGSGLITQGAAVSATAALGNGTVLFTIAGGSIKIISLMSICITAQGASATTLQYSSSPTVGSATTISGATTTLSGVAAGTTVCIAPTALSTAPVISLAAAGGVQLGTNVANQIIVNAGTITSVVASPTTGTWQHILNYIPLAPGVTVS